MTISTKSDRVQGFTLLEVLAAFVVFTLVFATVLQLATSALRSTARARDYTTVALLAESKLTEVLARARLELGFDQGEFDDRFRWELRITPFAVVQWSRGSSDQESSNTDVNLSGADPSAEDSSDLGVDELMRIELTTYWDSDRRREVFTTLASRLRR